MDDALIGAEHGRHDGPLQADFRILIFNESRFHFLIFFVHHGQFQFGIVPPTDQCICREFGKILLVEVVDKAKIPN